MLQSFFLTCNPVELNGFSVVPAVMVQALPCGGWGLRALHAASPSPPVWLCSRPGLRDLIPCPGHLFWADLSAEFSSGCLLWSRPVPLDRSLWFLPQWSDWCCTAYHSCQSALPKVHGKCGFGTQWIDFQFIFLFHFPTHFLKSLNIFVFYSFCHVIIACQLRRHVFSLLIHSAHSRLSKCLLHGVWVSGCFVWVMSLRRHT